MSKSYDPVARRKTYLRHRGKNLKYAQEYRGKHRAKILPNLRQYRLEHKDEIKQYQKTYRQNHPESFNNKDRTPEEWRARNYVQRHPEILGKKCELCGSQKDLCGHHPDYRYPQIIVTLCKSCHNWVHKSEVEQNE